MTYKIQDLFYYRIMKKIENGTFTEGNKCYLDESFLSLNDFVNKRLADLDISERTPEVCTFLLSYCKGTFSDVPETSKTREFFINSFTNNGVLNYIKKNIADFDRQFFKDLIATNHYAACSSETFAIMPLEYIDEEMCSLAIINSLDQIDDAWFYTVAKRKPEALTLDLWKLGARLYAKVSNNENNFLNITPEKYKDKQYFIEMCRCSFNCGSGLVTSKRKIMDTIPPEVITPGFLVYLLALNMENVAIFDEKALETTIPLVINGKVIWEKVWQLAVRKKGETIKNIPLNDERVQYFLSHYSKDSHEYKWAFQDNYRKYKKMKQDAEASKNSIPAINQATPINYTFLPIRYKGFIPLEYREKLDSEEYLEMMYKEIGVQIIEEYDDLFYRVILPEEWTIDRDDDWTYVKDNFGNIIIKFFYYGKITECEAYVESIKNPKDYSRIKFFYYP